MLLLSGEIFEASLSNSVEPDQTAPVGSGSTLFASIHMLTNKQTFSDVHSVAISEFPNQLTKN